MQETLEIAIQKAIDGGWMYGLGIGWSDVDAVLEIYHVVDTDEQKCDIDNCKLFIFDHDFARALWGDKPYETGMFYNGSPDAFFANSDLVEEVVPVWQHHLQQMVIANDPIKYLGENI